MSTNIKRIKKDFLIGYRFLRMALDIDTIYVLELLLLAVTRALPTIFNIYMFKLIVNELITTALSSQLISFIIIFLIVNMIFGLLINSAQYLSNLRGLKFVNSLEKRIGTQIMAMPYSNLENPEILDLKETALRTIYNQNAVQNIIQSITDIVSHIVSIVAMIVIVSVYNPLIILLLLSISTMSLRYYKKFMEQDLIIAQNTYPLNRSFMYYYKTTMDFSSAKDIRSFSVHPLIDKKISQQHEKFKEMYDPYWIKKGKYKAVSHIFYSIQIFCGYMFSIIWVLSEKIDIGDFTMITAAITKLSSSINELISSYSRFIQSCRFIDMFMTFMDIEVEKGSGKAMVGDIRHISVEFHNVFFRYPGQDEDVLHDISFKLVKGDILSLVGKNGAGKSTIVKLLCRLYKPTKGHININGVNIEEYSVDEYYKLISVLFQDFNLFSYSIRENIAFDNEASILELEKILLSVDLMDRVGQHINGIEGQLSKRFTDDGIELSGGQNQKLALARALYKGAPISIFDEPTSSLDVIAEKEIYELISDKVESQITIYISHRLSTTRLSNKILVIDGGKIVQEGDHDTLVKDHNGLYKRMWNAQAKYYASRKGRGGYNEI